MTDGWRRKQHRRQKPEPDFAGYSVWRGLVLIFNQGTVHAESQQSAYERRVLGGTATPEEEKKRKVEIQSVRDPSFTGR